jgi:hypothetical protein
MCLRANRKLSVLRTNSRNSEDPATGRYIQFKFKSIQYSNSFFPFFTKKWNLLPFTARKKPIDKFKEYLNLELKPIKHKPYSKGDKYKCSLLTRIRVGRSQLNEHTFYIGQGDTIKCKCSFQKETPLHYITQCPLYTVMRQTLFNKIEQFIPGIRQLTRRRQYEICVHGWQIDNHEVNIFNTKILIATQNFIYQTKRFIRWFTHFIHCHSSPFPPPAPLVPPPCPPTPQ